MNKLTKGAIAGAAGIALLLGGAGTFALWNTSVGVASGTVSTGTLSFGTTSGTTWKDASNGAASTTFDPTTQDIVPGDVVTLTQLITVNATGKNLKAQLAYSPSSVAIPTDLAPDLTVGIAATKASGDAKLSGDGTSGNPYIITPTAGGTSTFTVVLTFTFNPNTTGTAGQGESVDLTGAAYTLTQLHS